MRNDGIVSSFIYVSFPLDIMSARLIASQYYDSENISESRLSFRRATSEAYWHEQWDEKCMAVLYDMYRYFSSTISRSGRLKRPR